MQHAACRLHVLNHQRKSARNPPVVKTSSEASQRKYDLPTEDRIFFNLLRLLQDERVPRIDGSTYARMDEQAAIPIAAN
jgi:hypothetical protein